MKAGPGRPKGSKDRKFLTLQFWFDELCKDWPKLKPSVRAKLSVELMKLLANKMKSLPSDPQDSLFNANEALSKLKALETKDSVKPESNDLNKVSEPSKLEPIVINHPDGQSITRPQSFKPE